MYCFAFEKYTLNVRMFSATIGLGAYLGSWMPWPPEFWYKESSYEMYFIQGIIRYLKFFCTIDSALNAFFFQLGIWNATQN